MRTARTESQRRRELAAIHVAVKELGLDRETYEAVVERLTGSRSSKDLDAKGRHQLLDELRRLGATKVERRAHMERQLAGAPKDLRPAIAAQVGKVEALLADAGRPWSYGHSLAKRMFGVTRVEWLRGDQLQKLIAALSMDQRRRQAREGSHADQA